MATAIIDWPLTPYTGWGGYGIQLAQALMERGQPKPLLAAPNDRTPHCDLHWLAALDHLEACSQPLRDKLAAAEAAGHWPVQTDAAVCFSPLGNGAPAPRFKAERQVGITFFECSRFAPHDLKQLQALDLIVTGSRWNQALLTNLGLGQAQLVHQGVDTALFNPVAVPRLIQRSLVIFSGGKLEARKGQDVVIAAFRQLLRSHPDALLIAAWGNVGDVALNTIALSPHVQGAPAQGRAAGIAPWLEANGVPLGSVLLVPCIHSRQLPNLIKQADVAVFVSRCEGGTNLMAMETLACGVPTVLSANTGHLDLLELGLAHAWPVGQRGLGAVAPPLVAPYGGDPLGLWGETEPQELLDCWLRLAADKQRWRAQASHDAVAMERMSWRVSMARLMQLLQQQGVPVPAA
ncbi:MAG: glycosyltransferase family 4 protein [Cyanobacteriota bacterium]|nr:glycosyltransferase family 4 protein [Cyanobacteriota bacterium]